MMEILLKTIPCSKNINEVAGYFLATSFVFFKKNKLLNYELFAGRAILAKNF